MTDDRDPIQQFLERLRAQTDRPIPRGGVGRMARTLRSAVGTATHVFFARRGAHALGDADLETLERLVASLGELKGVHMKVGQILSYVDVTLPPESRRLLALLQTQSQPTPFPQVEQVLREDLAGRADALLSGLERDPVSVASIGQVHRARLPDGAPVAVKVRHPGIDEALRSDFKLAGAGTAFARLMMPGAGATAADIVAEAKERLLEECDYALEARRQRRFGELFAGDPDLVVPPVHEAWCGPRVLVTGWEDGEEFEAFASRPLAPATRDRLGAALFRLYVGTLYRNCLFHADPHPGNYRVRPDGRLAVFDFGCVREFDRPTVAALARLADSVRAGRDEGMREALGALGAAPPADEKAFAHVRALLRGYFGPMLQPGPRPVEAGLHLEVGAIMRDKLAMARLRLPGKLLFLFRIRFGLYAVLARLGAVCDWAALEQGLAREAR